MTPDEIHQLIVLDALGEATPEQRARLADALRADPSLAAEHAAMRLVAARLSEPAPAALPPMPADLATRLDAMHTPPAQKVISFPVLRRLALAATVLVLASLAWALFRPHDAPAPQLAQQPVSQSPAAAPAASDVPAQFVISGDAAEPAAPGTRTGGRRRAVVAAAECAGKDGARPPAAVKVRAADARKFRSLLVSQYGFKDSDIVTLINEEATSERIVSAINKHLIAQSQPGDVAVFMFSGHGSQVQDFDGDEDDGVDEAICPWDHNWSKVESWLTDDVIGNMAARLSQTNVLVVMDTCHAGTMTRGGDADERFAPMGVDSGFRPKARPPTPPAPPKTVPPPNPPKTVQPPTPPRKRDDGYLKPEDLFEQKNFPLPYKPRPAPKAPGLPNLRTEFTQEDVDRMNEAERIIRERNNRTDYYGPKPKGSLELEPLFEQKWFPLKEDEIRKRIVPLPDSGALDKTIEKLFKIPGNSSPPTVTEEDWETLKAAEEFMRQKNTFEPETLEMIQKFGTMTKAILNRHPVAAPHGAQVLLAATASDRYGWFSYSEGSHFLRFLGVAMERAADDTTFAGLIERITPDIDKSSKEAIQNWLKKGKDNPDDPAYQQKPEAEGATTAKVRDFMRGFSVSAPPPSPDMPPARPAPPITLNTWQQATGDIALALATDKLTYTEGDLIEITITADRDCHLRLFYLGADHQTYQIFPNQHQPDAAVKKGQPVRLGGAGGAFKLRAKAPFGNEILMAVASSRPFTDAESFRFESDLVKEFQNTNLEALGHRGIGVEAADAPLVGRALRLYRVEARK